MGWRGAWWKVNEVWLEEGDEGLVVVVGAGGSEKERSLGLTVGCLKVGAGGWGI